MRRFGGEKWEAEAVVWITNGNALQPRTGTAGKRVIFLKTQTGRTQQLDVKNIILTPGDKVDDCSRPAGQVILRPREDAFDPALAMSIRKTKS